MPLPAEWAKFKGLHLHGKHVVLEYTVQGVSVLDSPWAETKLHQPQLGPLTWVQWRHDFTATGPTTLTVRACGPFGPSTISNSTA